MTTFGFGILTFLADQSKSAAVVHVVDQPEGMDPRIKAVWFRQGLRVEVLTLNEWGPHNVFIFDTQRGVFLLCKYLYFAEAILATMPWN